MEHTYAAGTVCISASFHLFIPTLCISIDKPSTVWKLCRVPVTLFVPD